MHIYVITSNLYFITCSPNRFVKPSRHLLYYGVATFDFNERVHQMIVDVGNNVLIYKHIDI